VHRDPRSARSRRDGCDGVEPSGRDGLRLLIRVVNDTPYNDQRHLQGGVLLASATEIGTPRINCDAGTTAHRNSVNDDNGTRFQDAVNYPPF
jgi:hypothetical protein